MSHRKISYKAVLTSLSGTFALPSSEMLLLNESVTSQFIDINAIIPDSEDLQHHKVKTHVGGSEAPVQLQVCQTLEQ
ncbi:uncharacterized protein LOC123564828 isoform X4 [Mercenaria mercenaria]|uniref:uncharacterized protein LOC123564828 isoform X4 n=1 Tax=Mercenaria mercenaria TaxID=6596 RepID=UPI001E1DB8FF|nr:uncharacterized protein LOC123564828 isoform X4 [Mercenaria mercenaria]